MQKYILFLCFFALTKVAVFAQKIQNAINIFASDPIMKSGKLSFLAVDLQTDSIIASYQSDTALVSASITKLFTTATVFEVLGGDYSPVTRIYSDGFIDENGLLHGNIWIRGAGDVSLGSMYFNKPGQELDFLSQWADSILKKGIKNIEGAIIADASAFGYEGAPVGWALNDFGNYFGATHSGTSFYDNLIKLYFDSEKPGSDVKLVNVYPKIDDLVFQCEVKASSSVGDNCYLFGAPFSLDRTAKGTISANVKGFEVKGSMPDPELQLAKEWSSVLVKKGVSVGDGAKGYRLLLPKLSNDYSPKFNLLFSHNGKNISDVAYWTNLKSVNLYAEGLLGYLGYANSGLGSTSSGLKALNNYWTQKIPISNMIINDGSGLSRLNAISATNFCDLLTFMFKSPNYIKFKSTLPVAGVSGTLRNICKGQVGQGRVFAKSGTLNQVKAYAGYVETISGKKIAFSFCVNKYSCSVSQLIKKMEVILNALATY